MKAPEPDTLSPRERAFEFVRVGSLVFELFEVCPRMGAELSPNHGRGRLARESSFDGRKPKSLLPAES
jgi:hypothetical protein